MTNKTIKLEIVGFAPVIDAALDAFIRCNGWTEESLEDDGETPLTKEKAARNFVRKYIMDDVKRYNEAQAAAAAIAAASAQTEAALDMTTMTLVVE